MLDKRPPTKRRTSSEGPVSRRRALQAAASTLLAAALPRRARAAPGHSFSLATFSADVTVPIGHPLMGGGVAPAARVDDPLRANGCVLFGGARPIVLVAIDWCEIRNDAYRQWQQALAEAAQTEPADVLVTSVHQHDAPVVDLAAQRILEDHRCAGRICDPQFHQRAVSQVAQALCAALRTAQPVTHVGVGRAKVNQVASNRRYHRPDGPLRFDRTSATRDPVARAAEVGTIDPWLRTLSYWNGDRPLAAIHAYATHPMSYYGQGGVSSDFVGLARERMQRDNPSVRQIYLSGASGNVTAGKYNDGSPANRPLLAQRLYAAMKASLEQTSRHGLKEATLRHAALWLAPRESPGFTTDDLRARLSAARPFDQCLAAMGLSFRQRHQRGEPLDLPVLDLGVAQLAILPGESYVEYQLMAQEAGGESFVMVAGYGECATGYVPIERAWEENDTNLRDWCWVAPGAARVLRDAIRQAIRPAASLPGG